MWPLELNIKEISLSSLYHRFQDAQKSSESRDQWDLVYCLTCDSSCIMWILSSGVKLLESLASGLSFCCFGCLEHRWAQAAINRESHRCDSLTLVSLTYFSSSNARGPSVRKWRVRSTPLLVIWLNKIITGLAASSFSVLIAASKNPIQIKLNFTFFLKKNSRLN